MAESIAILGGDERMRILSHLLAKDSRNICTWSIEGGENPQALCDAVNSDTIILPLPMQRDGKLNGTDIEMTEIWKLLRSEQHIFAGGVSESDREQAQARGLKLVDYLKCEELAVRNAVPTAEGAIEAAMERLTITLNGAEVLVVGFGRIGKMLAHDLRGLGAHVSVSARKLSDLAWIDAFGYQGLQTNHLTGQLGKIQVVFNTVPHQVFDEYLLSELPQDCLLIELASASGFDLKAIEKLRMNYVKALGLPGKVAPESAVRAIKTTLCKLMEEMQ